MQVICARMGFVIENFDNIEVLDSVDKVHQNKDQTPSPIIKISKKINGTYYVVESVPDSNAKSLYVKSAYISNNSNGSSGQLKMPYDPQLTSETLARSSAVSTISDTVVSSKDDAVGESSSLGMKNIPPMYVQDVKETVHGNSIPQNGGFVKSEAVGGGNEKIVVPEKKVDKAAYERAFTERRTTAVSESALSGDDVEVGKTITHSDLTQAVIDQALNSNDSATIRAAKDIQRRVYKNTDEMYRAIGRLAKAVGITGDDVIQSRAASIAQRYENSIRGSEEAVTGIDNTSGKEYNNTRYALSGKKPNKRKNSYYSQYRTQAMIWANNASRKVGDLKVFNRDDKGFVLIQATEDGFIEVFDGSYEEVREYERSYERASGEINENSDSVKSRETRSNRAVLYAGFQEPNSGSDSQIGSDGLQSDSTGSSEYLRDGDKGKSVNEKSALTSESDSYDEYKAFSADLRQKFELAGDEVGIQALDYLDSMYEKSGMSGIETVATDGIEYSESNRNIAAENYVSGLQYAFRANGDKTTKFEVYYDSSEGAKRGEWKVDGKGNVTIRINGAKVRGAESASWALSHELFHSAAKNNPGIVNRVFETFEKIGIYDSSKFEAYKEAYRSEYEAAYKGRLDSGEITQEQYDELVNNYVREEIAADLMMDVMGNEELANMFAQNSTKEDLNFIARFFRRFVDAIKKVFGGDKKHQQYVYDAEKLLGVFERAVKGFDGKKNRSNGIETRNAIVESVESDTGDVYKDAVLLDTDIFSGKSFKERSKALKDYIYNNFAGKKITVKNDDGDSKVIEFARSNERVTKDGAKNSHKVIDKLATKTDRNSQLAAAHADEIVYVSESNDLNPDSPDNNHQWLDYNGWEYRNATLVLPNGEILEANLNIAKTKDGRNILYDINKIKTIGRASLPISELRKNAKQSGLHTIPDGDDSISQKNDVVKSKSALSSKSASKSNQTISENFKKWFGDWQNSPETASKVVNADGTPKVMYHGSPEQFTIFDKKKAKSSGAYGRGFYFTDSDSHAKQYGNLYAVYLDVKNPLKQGESKVTESQIRKYLEAVAENEDYSIENYGTYDVSEIMKKIESRDAFAVIQDINATAIGDMVEAAKLWNEVNGTNFDGIVAPTETVVFEPTQVKSATDNIGTFDKNNPDIRYAVSAPSAKENSVFSPEQRKKIIPMLTKLAGSQGIARLSKNEFVTDVMNILEKTLDTGIVSDKVYEDIARTIYEYAREDAGDASVAGTYIDIKKRLYKMGKIYVSEAVKNDIPDYNDFRKQFGTLLTTKEDASYLSVDEVFADLKADYPDVFSEDLNLGDQLQKIAEVLETARKYENDNGLVSVSELYTFDKVKNDYLEMADDIVEGISALSGIELVDETEVYETLRGEDESVSATELPDELYITKGMTDEQVDAVLEKVRATSSKNSPEYKFIKRLFEAERNVENAKKNLRSVEKLAKTKGFEADSKRVVDFTKALANEFGFGSDVAKTADVGRELKGLCDAVAQYVKTGDDAALDKVVSSIGDVALKIGETTVNCQKLVNMESVSNLTGSEFDGDMPLREKIKLFFDSLGGSVHTESFGDIALTNSSIRSDMRHGTTRDKVVAYAAIPDVLKNGVAVETKQKNNGEVERTVIAAPIIIGETPYFMGVMIQRDSNTNRLYLHDVIIKKEASDYHTEHLNTTGPDGNSENLFLTDVLEKAVSVGYSISQNTETVNTSSDEFIDKLGGYILGNIMNVAKGRKVLQDSVRMRQ